MVPPGAAGFSGVAGGVKVLRVVFCEVGDSATGGAAMALNRECNGGIMLFPSHDEFD
jgi:hypothetical protein